MFPRGIRFPKRQLGALRARFWIELARHARQNACALVTLVAFCTATVGAPVGSGDDCGCRGTKAEGACCCGLPTDAASSAPLGKKTSGCCGKGVGCRCAVESRTAGTCCCSGKSNSAIAAAGSTSKRSCCNKRDRDSVIPTITNCACGSAPKSIYSANAIPKLPARSVELQGIAAARFIRAAELSPHAIISHEPPTPPPERLSA